MSNTFPPNGANKDKKSFILPPTQIKRTNETEEDTYAPGNYDYIPSSDDVTPVTESVSNPVTLPEVTEPYMPAFEPVEVDYSYPTTEPVTVETTTEPAIEEVVEQENIVSTPEPQVNENRVEGKTSTPEKLLTSSDFDTTGDDIFDNDEPFFGDVPRTLTVNEQPFFRWLKRVALALIITSVFVVAVSFYVKAPLELSIAAVGSVWVVILAITAPDAIIPYKKTRFNLTDNTVRVGQKKPRPIAEIQDANLNTDKKNVKLWLSFADKKDGFFVPLKSSKITMKREDLLALRTIIPHTSISEADGVKEINFEEKAKDVPVSQPVLTSFIEQKIDSLKK